MTYTCPVCGYDQLPAEPARFLICPSCGTEFGYHDYFATQEDLRAQWIANGARWWSSFNSPPPLWSPVEQLRNAGIELTDTELEQITDIGYAHGEVELPITSTTQATRVIIGRVRDAQEALVLSPNSSARVSNLPADARTAVLEYA